MKRLSQSVLGGLPSTIKIPAFDRSQTTGIIHLGLGAFHRAHQAMYVNNLLESGEQGWMIEGVSLRHSHVAEQLNPQGGLYSVRIRSNSEDYYEVMGAIKNVTVAANDPASLVSKLASPDIKLVTITVTEKGYCLDLANGVLDENDPVVRNDIENINAPATMPGFLVAALSERIKKGIAPFTVVSCDNLPNNGEKTKAAVLQLAERTSPSIVKWIERETLFPSSMVDRIVPATTKSDIEAYAAKTGLLDEATVSTEPFSQWVIEDKFCNDRPPLEKVGVQFVDDVAGWEKLKLRMLNGAHSSMAYLGGLMGVRLVDEMMSVPGYRKFLHTLWDEMEQTLPQDIAPYIPDYRSQLIERFQNNKLQHQTAQIAIDGSQKLPQRLITPLYERMRTGQESPALTLAVAAWLLWLRGTNERGAPYAINDPLKDVLSTIAAQAGNDTNALVHNILKVSEVFGEFGSKNFQLHDVLVSAIQCMAHNRVKVSLSAF